MTGLAKLVAGPGGLALAERPIRAPEPGMVRLTVLAAGVCGTDLHIEAGEYPSVPPVTLGHEVCGVVEEAGEGVGAGWIGRRVVCETFFSTCGRCRWCRDGRRNLCPERRSIGSHVDGAFAPRLVVPEINLHAVPDDIGDHAAALAEPLACVCQCMLDPSTVSPGDRVLVTGPGPMGLLAAQVARALGGAVEVHGLPSDRARLEVARELGFVVRETVGGNGGRAEHARDGLGGAADGGERGSVSVPVDVAVDTSGSAGGMAACLHALRRGGRFVQIGIAGRPATVPVDLVLERELEVSTGFASTPRAWRRALTLIERGAVVLDPLVSEVARLDEWERVFDDLRNGRGVKAVFDPRLSAEQASIIGSEGSAGIAG